MIALTLSRGGTHARVRDTAVRPDAPADEVACLATELDPETGASAADRARVVEACAALAPRFVWLDVDPDDAADWLRALAARRLPVALVPPAMPSLPALDAALADAHVASLPTAVALPRLYHPGVARLVTLARAAGAGRLVAIEGSLVAAGVRGFARGVGARAERDAVLAAVEAAVTLLARLGVDLASIALDDGAPEAFFDRLRLVSTANAAIRVDLSLGSERRSGDRGGPSETLVVSGARWSIAWTSAAGRETLAVTRGGAVSERPLAPEDWASSFAAAFLRQIDGQAEGWITLANHRAELALALELTHAFLYEHDREVRRVARRRLLDEARARGPFWQSLAAFPSTRTSDRPVFLAGVEQCRALAEPLAQDFRLLLVRAPSPVVADNWLPPIGLAQLAAAVAPMGVRTTLVDLAPVTAAYERLGRPEVSLPAGVLASALEARLGGASFDLAGLSRSHAATWPGVRDEVVPALRRRAPRVVVGGCVVGHMPPDDPEHGLVDFVLEGEAEVGLVALIRHLVLGHPEADVPGLRRPGERAVPSAPVVVPSFAWTGVPCYDGLDLSFYRTVVPGLQAPYLPYQTSRGCPYACAFCADESSHKVRERPAAHVVRDLRALRDRYGVRDFFLLDNLLNVSPRFLSVLLDALEAADLGLRFVDCARPSGLDDATLVRLRRVGCTQLTFGLDGASDRVLTAMNKGFTVAEAERTVRGAHAAGIQAVVNLITGMPGETDADFDDGLRLVDRLRPYAHGFRVMRYNYVAGSPLYNEPGRFGLHRRGDRFDVVGGESWRRHRELREARAERLRVAIGEAQVV